MLSDFQQPGGGNGQGIGFRRRRHTLLICTLSGRMRFRQAGDGVHGGVIVAYAAEQHDFEPDLPVEGTRGRRSALRRSIEIKGTRRGRFTLSSNAASPPSNRGSPHRRRRGRADFGIHSREPLVNYHQERPSWP